MTGFAAYSFSGLLGLRRAASASRMLRSERASDAADERLGPSVREGQIEGPGERRLSRAADSHAVPVAAADGRADASLPSVARSNFTAALWGIAGLCGATAAAVILVASHRSEWSWTDATLPATVALLAAFQAGRTLRRSSPRPARGDPSRPGRHPPASPPTAVVARSSGRGSTSVPASPSRSLAKEGQGRPKPALDAAVGGPDAWRAVDRDQDQVRRHARVRPRHRSVNVTTEQGVEVSATILDLSRSGVALEGTIPGVWVGSMVTVGSRRAKAVRMLPNGMALEFSVPIPVTAFDAQTTVL